MRKNGRIVNLDKLPLPHIPRQHEPHMTAARLLVTFHRIQQRLGLGRFEMRGGFFLPVAVTLRQITVLRAS